MTTLECLRALTVPSPQQPEHERLWYKYLWDRECYYGIRRAADGTVSPYRWDDPLEPGEERASFAHQGDRAKQMLRDANDGR